MAKFEIEKYNNDQLFMIEAQAALNDIIKAERLMIALITLSVMIIIPTFLFLPNRRGYVIIEAFTITKQVLIIAIVILIVYLFLLIATLGYIQRTKSNRFKSYIVRKVLDRKVDLKLYHTSSKGFRKRKSKLQDLFGFKPLKTGRQTHSDHILFNYRMHDIRYMNLTFLYEQRLFQGFSLLFKLPKSLKVKRTLIISQDLEEYADKIEKYTDAPIFAVEDFANHYILARQMQETHDINTEQELQALNVWEKEMQSSDFFPNSITDYEPAPSDTFSLREILTRDLGELLSKDTFRRHTLALLIDKNIMVLTLQVQAPLFQPQKEYKHQQVAEVMDAIGEEVDLLLHTYVDPMIDVLDKMFPLDKK